MSRLFRVCVVCSFVLLPLSSLSLSLSLFLSEESWKGGSARCTNTKTIVSPLFLSSSPPKRTGDRNTENGRREGGRKERGGGPSYFPRMKAGVSGSSR